MNENPSLANALLDGAYDLHVHCSPDVVPRAWVPTDLDHVALGHIHRRQDLSHPDRPDLLFSYPGATERTSRAERLEEKGYLLANLEPGGPGTQEFVPLPSRPMLERSPA